MPRSSQQTVRFIARSLYEFLYPPVCLSCDVFLSDSSERICARCSAEMRPITAHDPLYQEMKERLMASGAIAGLASAFHFEKEGKVQELIHGLKYEELTASGVVLGRYVAHALQRLVPDAQLAGVVPIPLHRTKLRERGYNQSEYIARGVRDVLGLPVLDKVMQRTRNTRSQTTLTLTERKENISGAFSVNLQHTHRIKGKAIVIIDDVITTGATIVECATILKQHGADTVYAASIALAAHAAEGALPAEGSFSVG